MPVDIDSEAGRLQFPRVPGGGERDRHLRERVGAVLELRLRLLRGQPADVDAVDADAPGDRARRAGEDESDHGCADREDDEQHGEALCPQHPGTAASTTADPDRSSPCVGAQAGQFTRVVGHV